MIRRSGCATARQGDELQADLTTRLVGHCRTSQCRFVVAAQHDRLILGTRWRPDFFAVLATVSSSLSTYGDRKVFGGLYRKAAAADQYLTADIV